MERLEKREKRKKELIGQAITRYILIGMHYIYIQIYICVCVCVYIYIYIYIYMRYIQTFLHLSFILHILFFCLSLSLSSSFVRYFLTTLVLS